MSKITKNLNALEKRQQLILEQTIEEIEKATDITTLNAYDVVSVLLEKLKKSTNKNSDVYADSLERLQMRFSEFYVENKYLITKHNAQNKKLDEVLKENIQLRKKNKDLQDRIKNLEENLTI